MVKIDFNVNCPALFSTDTLQKMNDYFNHNLWSSQFHASFPD